MTGSKPTQQTTDTRPAVYGYLRTDEAMVSSLRTDLRIFCVARDWRLATVFCDRDSDGSETARPGFAAALDVLTLPANTTLVVPNLAHLSPDATVRAALASMVRRAGARVIVADALNGKPTSTPDTSR